LKQTKFLLQIQNGKPWKCFNKDFEINYHRLVAIKAVSLAIAVMANLSLLLSLAHRLDFTISQPITILGWYIASIMLIVVVSILHNLQSASDYTLSQSFYYACIACAIYFIMASLLVITTWGAYKNYYDPDFSLTLTLPQRTLMAQSLIFIVYLLCGAAVFAHIEDWFFVDGVYWATVTLLTIGYGDVVPLTHLGRSLIIPYAIAGIVMIGLVVGSIGALVLDKAQQKMGARMTVHERELLEAELDDPNSNEEGGSTSPDYKALPREKREFNLMRRIQSRASLKQRWTLLAISTLALIILWFIGAVIFWQTESTDISFQSPSWTYFESIYFVFISLLTIGYGDFAVRSNAGRPLLVFWVLLAVPTMTILIASMGATVLIVIKGIIHKIDAFIVLPHERGHPDSFTAKAMHMGKLKMKAKVKPGENGVEKHDGGTRNTSTGKVMNLDEHVNDLPANHAMFETEDEDHDERRELRYLIAKEIGMLLGHVSDSPAKIYSFEEWTRFLHLLGIRGGYGVGNDQTDREIAENGAVGKTNGPDYEKWSWLGDESPLFSNKTETEWLLQRLSRRLEEDLGRQRAVGRSS
jgi:potassium channel subfamily K, other eukaryote